jgi:hypothetical protein
MRKVVALTVGIFAIVILLASPALAKDPFEPQVTTQDVNNDSATGGTTDTNGEPAVIGVPSNPTTESMPNTGSDLSSWLVLSYGLVVVGGAAYVVGRSLSTPQSSRRSRGLRRPARI